MLTTLAQPRIAAVIFVLLNVVICVHARSGGGIKDLTPSVEVENEVYAYEPANNGAGPLWCHGSTCLARVGDRVFASGLESLADAKPLNNCRWLLFERGAGGWERILSDPAGRTREPCPLVAFADGRVFLSANPTLVEDRTKYAGPARPELWEFNARTASTTARQWLPEWRSPAPFTEHSYRSFAADAARRELILFQNIDYTHAEFTARDRRGRWFVRGWLPWPWGADYAKPQPIRVCYPNVALQDRAVHFCGVSDIEEPNPAWRAFKHELTGQHWDYDFRRLFYTWSRDIRTARFEPWIEIASRDKTGGWITPGDLWAAPDGRVHVLWSERALDERLRAKFFPGEKQSHALNYAVLQEGHVILRRTLALAEEGGSREIPGRGRFHVLPGGRLGVVYFVSGADAAGKSVAENRWLELRADGSFTEPVKISLAHPLSDFFTATPRAGSAPSRVLDLLGQRADTPNKICYARIRFR